MRRDQGPGAERGFAQEEVLRMPVAVTRRPVPRERGINSEQKFMFSRHAQHGGGDGAHTNPNECWTH